MPIAMDKDGIFEYVLATDRKKPKASRPTFCFRPQTMRQWQQLCRETDKIDDDKITGVEAIDLLCNMISKSMSSWKNMTDVAGKVIRFNKKRLADIISMPEAHELIEAIKNQGVTVDDEKN